MSTDRSPNPRAAATTAAAIPVPDEPPLVILPMPRVVMYVAIVWLLYFLDFMARFGVNPLYPLIQKELELTDAQVGLLGSVVLFGMAALVMPLSFLADRWSRSKLLSLMALVWSACSIVSGFATSLPTLLAARCGLGVGEASFAPTATSLLTSWFRRATWGRVLGFFNTAVSLGIFCGSVFSGYMAVTYGWRAALICLGVPGIVLGLLALTIPDAKAATPAGAGGEGEVKLTVRSAAAVVARNRSLKLLVVFYGFINMGVVAILSWMPMYYTRVMDLPVQKAATLAGVTALLGVVGYPLGGYLSDLLVKKDLRYRMWFPSLAALVVAVLFALGFSNKSIPVILVACFVFSFISPPLNAASQELVPARFRSVSLGVVIFGMQAIGMIGPWLTGALSMRIGLMNALIAMQIAFLLSFVGFLVAARKYRQDCDEAVQADRA